MITESMQMEPDYEFVAYAGMDDRDYPLWQTLDFGDDWLFLHGVELADYGYDVDDDHEDEVHGLPKNTSDGNVGSVRYTIGSLDRFACRLQLRGHLKGASHELVLDILIRLNVLGYRRGGMLGFAGETLAEGYAFELEGRSKQAFFCYFSALDSLIEVHRQDHNCLQQSDFDLIPENDRLSEKMRRLVVAALPDGHPGLNGIIYWGSLRAGFAKMERLRNAIAHNQPHGPIEAKDAEEVFVVFAIMAAILHGAAPDPAAIIDWYAIF